MHRLAAAIAAQGRWILIAGLIVGLAAPQIAALLRPSVGPLVVLLLFLAMLRIGPAGLRAGRNTLWRAGLIALAQQCALPCLAAVVLAGLGLLHHPFGLATVLILAAAPLTGAAPIAVMAGADPAPAMRQSVIGTALLPATVLPVFALAPAFGSAAEVLTAVLRLLLVVGLAGGLALILRQSKRVPDTPEALCVIDAAAAVVLGVVVVGMMGAAGATLRSAPLVFAGAMCLVCLIAFGLQAAVVRFWRTDGERAALAVTAGCRNVALFVGVLPAAVTDDLLLLIGCYQIPMYLTPLVLPWLLRMRRGGDT